MSFSIRCLMLPSKLQKIAVALKYKYLEDKEPRVIASGKGIIAEAILRKAQEFDVPVHKDSHLAFLLSKVEIGSPIPEELYDVVAQLIAMIYKMDTKAGQLM